VEKVLCDVDEKTCLRRPITTEIVAEAEPRLVKQESSDSSEEGHDTPIVKLILTSIAVNV